MADIEKDPYLSGGDASESDSDSDNDSLGVGSIQDIEEIYGGEEDDEQDNHDSDDEEDADEQKSNASIQEEYNPAESDSDEEEEEEDDDYLQKLDEHVRAKVIEDHHPELKTLNYEEVEALATVVRDKNHQIIDPLHRTLPVLTRYEKARVLGERARQINSGAKPAIEVEPTMIDGYLIALKELEQKRVPFIIQRPLPNGGSEYWRVADLE
jgi:DNA-directed RNA polymerase I, II, and III subunit RPABC2